MVATYWAEAPASSRRESTGRFIATPLGAHGHRRNPSLDAFLRDSAAYLRPALLQKRFTDR